MLQASKSEATSPAVELAQMMFDAPGPCPYLVIRYAKFSGHLDLSFRKVGCQLIIVDCVLEEEPTFEGADKAGLELHRCRASRLELDWAHVRSDLRLVDVTVPLAGGGEPSVRVTATGTLVNGRVEPDRFLS